jgi:hypothetical protein
MNKGSKEIQDLLTRQGCIWVDGQGWETDGNVDLSYKNLKELPTFSRGRVGGGFNCDPIVEAHPLFDIYLRFVKNGMPELAAKTAAGIVLETNKPFNQELSE